MSEYPLVNIGDLAKPATVLIEKISGAIGGIFEPYQIVRVAKAEAEAEKIQAESQIEITDLHRRAMHRFLNEEAKKQINIEDITQKAFPHLEQDASPQNVEDDWVTNFFDKSRIVSDDDMQNIWARVLAGEANAPGAFSRKTVNLLGDLDKGDAELLMRLCGFGWSIRKSFLPLVYDVDDEVYNRHGITFGTLTHLDSLGLVQFDNLDGFKVKDLPQNITLFYHAKPVELTFPKEVENDLNIGKVLLTRAGRELAPVCDSKSVDGFFDYVFDRWASESLVPKEEPKQDSPAKDG